MDSQSKTESYRPVLADRRRTSPSHPHVASGPGQLRRQRTAEGSLSPAPAGGNGRDSRNVFDRLAQDGARRYRALSPPEGRDNERRTMRKGGVGYNSDTFGTTSSVRRSPRTPLGSPTSPTSASCGAPEEQYYPRGPYSPAKGVPTSDRHSPNVSLVKQRRSTSEGPGGRDATLVEIVGYLGDDKACDADRAPDCSPSHDQKDDYLGDARVQPLRGGADPRRPLGRDRDTELRRLGTQNDKLRKQVDVLTKDKRDLEQAQEKLRAEMQQLKGEMKEKWAVKEDCISVQEANQELEQALSEAKLEAKAQHETQIHNFEKQIRSLKSEHDKEVAKIQSTRSREKVEFKDLIWKLESQLKLDKNAQSVLTPGEVARLLRMREDTTSARNVELEFENAMLREENMRITKENHRALMRLQACQEPIASQVPGAERCGSPKKAAGGGA